MSRHSRVGGDFVFCHSRVGGNLVCGGCWSEIPVATGMTGVCC